MVKALIISGDQETAREVERLIELCCPDISVGALVGDIKNGVLEINTNQPDLLILDTFLIDGSEFDLLNHFEKPDFKVLFVSEYMEYAIKAIEYNAIAYLLKPIAEQKFTTSINKATERITREEKLQLQLLGHTMEEMKAAENIILRTSDQIHSVKPSDIIRLEADGHYTTFYMTDGRKVIVSKSSSEFADTLLENGFFRIHKSHMINIHHLKYFNKAEGGSVVMVDESVVPVASRKRDAVIELLEKLS